MAEVSGSEATLRFICDDLDPEEVSQRLAIEPTSAMRKGFPHQLPNGRTVPGRTGGWSLRAASSSPADLNKQVQELLAAANADDATWQDLARRFDGHIFAGLFLEEGGTGTRLDAQTMAALAAKGLSLDLDIYFIGRDQGHGTDAPRPDAPAV